MPYRPNAHNPSNVPLEHWQQPGWRLMDADEVGSQFTTPLPFTHRWSSLRQKWMRRRHKTEMWTASSRNNSYLTKLSRNRIRALRGLPREHFPPDVPPRPSTSLAHLTIPAPTIVPPHTPPSPAFPHVPTPAPPPEPEPPLQRRKRIRKLEW